MVFFFANISVRQSQLCCGPIVTHLIQVWRSVEKICDISCRWHLQSPIFNNKGLLIGGETCHLFSVGKGRDTVFGWYFRLGWFNFFFYLQLRAALKAHGVPWQHPLPTHPLHDLIVTKRAEWMCVWVCLLCVFSINIHTAVSFIYVFIYVSTTSADVFALNKDCT